MTEEQRLKRDAAIVQIQKLDARLGKGVGAIKERIKLNKLIGEKNETARS